MTKSRRTAMVAATLAVGALVATTGGVAEAATKGLPGIALYADGTKLAKFDTNNPGSTTKIGDLDNLVGDTSLIGIDQRVQNRRLYGVGDQGGIYLLSTTSANTRKVGQLSIPLDGTNFGVDFNPAANALRIVSDTGQNLRQPFGTGEGPTVATVADSGLNYATVAATGVTAAAYTNNDLNTDTATTLYDIDTNLDQVAIQSPANSGSLAATGLLGVAAEADAGFDIYSDLSGGKTQSVKGFAAITSTGYTRLLSIDLVTGDADNEGRFNKDISDIALNLDK